MLFLPALAAQVATVDLFRGATIGTPGYWAVEDAYLDKAEPKEDHGGGFTLLGGDGRTILLRFGDLQRTVGRGMRVTSAKLVLTPSGGATPSLTKVTAVDAPWGEGSQTTLTRILANVESDPSGKKQPTATRGAATWTERRAGLAPWPEPGTPGGTAVSAAGATGDKTFEIVGLGATVQGWLDRPWTNHGLALNFAGEVEFFSSQSPSARPRLVLTLEPVVTTMETKPDLAVVLIAKEGGKWTAHVRNVGSAPAPATKGAWWTDGKAGASVDVPALAPGAEATVALVGGEPKDDPQEPTLAFAVGPVAKDIVPSNDRLDEFPGGKPVKLSLAAGLDPNVVVAYWNETVARQSRFSFAPDGVKGRVRLESSTTGEATLADALRGIGTQLGLPSGDGKDDLYPGLMGYGDTRFDGTIPGRLALSYEPYPDPSTETALLEPTGLLSATDVGRLNDGNDKLPLPKVALLRVADLSGRPLVGVELTLEGPALGAQKIVTGPGGNASLPVVPFKPDLSNGTLVVRATVNGVTASSVVKAWRLSDAVRRSGSPVVIADVRLNVPMAPLETGTDLAAGKPFADSTGKPAAGALPSMPGDWIEMDLGRDRTIGEIALKTGPGAFPERYEIRVYETGGKPETAALWATESASGWTRRNRAEDGWLVYRAPTSRIRFVRIVAKSGGAGVLTGVRVVPVRLSTAP